jgi:hypothetical protein
MEWDDHAADEPRRRVNRAGQGAWREQMDRGNRRAPVLTGRLRGSARLVSYREDFHQIEYHVPYAWRQHLRHGWMSSDYIDVSEVERSIAASAGED